MDLLFSRYASPFVLVDTLIQNNSLSEYIMDMYSFVNDDKEWEFFLHKVFEQTWNEFKESTQPVETKPIDLGVTLNKSKNMLLNFNPEGGE